MEKAKAAAEYVIYCRKSTDESSGKQASSIPQQLEACVQYADREGIRIRGKPAEFEFETESELAMEDGEADIADQRAYKKYRHLYVVRERKSAKEP